MHGKDTFSKINGSICNVPIEAANKFNILAMLVFSNESIVVELKQSFKYRGHVYFDPVCRKVINQALAFLKSHNEFYEDISVTNSLPSEEIFRCSSIVKTQGENKSATEKIIPNKKEVRESLYDTDTKILRLKIL